MERALTERAGDGESWRWRELKMERALMETSRNEEWFCWRELVMEIACDGES